jgi:hypothetical protein
LRVLNPRRRSTPAAFYQIIYNQLLKDTDAGGFSAQIR